jgi:catalase
MQGTQQPSSDNVMRRETGCPIGHAKNSMTCGPMGPVVLSDTLLLEKVLHFNREQQPPRNVHALGQGAYGSFTVTNDITKYTCADLFSQVGKKTDLFARFSGVFTERGDADTVRDPRGFAMKYYTKEGNWDILGINTPVFAVRDMKTGPDCIHAFKRDPRNGCWHPTQTWDFVATHPEGLHQTAMLYTDRTGTPMSYRTMHAWGCHTFGLINANKERTWCKFHFVSQQGALGFTADQAKIVAGEDPNFLSRDLVQAIDQGNFPRWKMMIQVMPEEEGYKYPWVFDPTKVWKHADYPLIEVGIVEINRNVIDYHTEVEQVAFSPATLVPGIGLSPDKLLQGRLLVYDDTQMHRIGPNFKQLYVNRPHGIAPSYLHVGGNMSIDVANRFPHYWPSVFGGKQPDSSYIEPPLKSTGDLVGMYDWPEEGSDMDLYAQVRDFWNVLDEVQKTHLCMNIAISIEKVKDQRIVDMMMGHFSKVNPAWAEGVQSIMAERMSGKKTQSEVLCDSFAKKLLSIRPQSQEIQ